jgi:dienelactone hydrolase
MRISKGYLPQYLKKWKPRKHPVASLACIRTKIYASTDSDFRPIRMEVFVPTLDKDVSIRTLLYEPTKVVFPHAVIIAFPDAWGIDAEKTQIFLKRVSDAAGVHIVFMDTFRGDPLNGGTPIGFDFKKLPGWFSSHPFDIQVYPDICTVIKHWKTTFQDKLQHKIKVATIGFCLGGNFSFQTLCDKDQIIDFGVACYPSRFEPEKAVNLSFPMFALFGEFDNVIPLESVAKLEKILAEGKDLPEHKVQLWKGVGHAFAHSIGSKEEEIKAAQEAFDAIVEWYQKHFK